MAVIVGRNPYRPREPLGPTPTRPGQGGMFESSRPATGTYYGGSIQPGNEADQALNQEFARRKALSEQAEAQRRGGGGVSYSQQQVSGPSVFEQRQQRERQQQSIEKILDTIRGLSSARTSPRVQYEGEIGGQEEAARGAAFARAKEMAAMNAQAALAGLQTQAEETGQFGSTMDAARRGAVVGGARADIQDFIREQLMQDLGRSREVANMRYQGGITQRGQDLGRGQSAAQQALLSLLSSGSLY